MAQDYYDILGVSRSASKDEIKKAYRKMARKYHPDTNQGDKAAEDKFKDVTKAYETLSDDSKKSGYDNFGEAGAGAGGGGGFNPNDFSGFGGGFGGGFDINDIFEQMNGNRGGSRRSGGQSHTGEDVHITMSLDFKDAIFGVKRSIELTKNEKCAPCTGKGYPKDAVKKSCGTCGGQGVVSQVVQTFFGQMQQQVTCSSCSGEGETYSQKCTKCSGVGIARERSSIKVEIPEGVDNGSTVRMRGHGHAGQKGASSGDLYIHIEVSHSRDFKREGSDIHSTLHITIPQAVLGDEVEIKTVHGKSKIVIPAGTIHGHKMKLTAKGAPILSGGGRKGSHFVHIEIDIPKKLSKKEAEAYHTLAQESGIDIKTQSKESFIKKLFS